MRRKGAGHVLEWDDTLWIPMGEGFELHVTLSASGDVTIRGGGSSFVERFSVLPQAYNTIVLRPVPFVPVELRVRKRRRKRR